MEKSTPKYKELANWIVEQIETKNLCAGQKLYSENELSDMFGLSRQTVRHAISVLEQDGVLNRVQGSGTYINDTRPANQGKSNRIAVITTYVDGYIFPRTIQGIENALFEQGYSVQIAFTNNLFDRERTILEDILERNEVAGIISETVKSGLPNPNIDLYREILRRRIPVLFINSFYRDLPIPHVSMNDREAGKIAAQCLIRKGHKRIGGIFKLDDGQGHLRYAGAREALREAGLSYKDINVVWVDTEDVKHLDRCSVRILERIRGCTGIVTYNDEVAFSLMEIFKQSGIRVPEDISIVSIDDSELAVLGEVELTAVPYPMEKLGKKAVEILTAMIQNPGFNGNYEFELYLTERDSVKDLRTEEEKRERQPVITG